MMIKTFVPPFKLVGGYLILGLSYLFLSIFVYFNVDFSSFLSFHTASFFHIYLVGFVISVIIGALYQLTSVILEKDFYSIKFAFLNFIFYAFSIVLFSYGMFIENIAFMYSGGIVLFLSIVFFCISYLLSFKNAKVKNYAYLTFFVGGFFLLIGVLTGFFLLLAVSGSINLDIEVLFYYHIYFVLGFIYLIILGASSVLIPMFTLSHKNSFLCYKISFVVFLCIGVNLTFSLKLAEIFLYISLAFFVVQVILILKNRVRRNYDYWNLNIIFSFLFLFLAIVLYLYEKNSFVFALTYGFLYAFIVGHLYKIVPFLVWYHYVSPFVGKKKVPMLEDMINKNLAYISLFFNIFSVFLAVLNLKYMVALFLFMSVICVIINMVNIFKYIKFS
ncbi:peptidase M50 [Campylobacter sputorum subsp. bubulus]|uniref:Peptidase M50 n=1 Tax=Campylobacter sputorum subsp. sputorum TaxID=32024 RepID=A0A381DI29_9BACT|nr:hypothetical protein [Campylobacter sputorum]ASM35407.1 putative membrane protein [Campylobacter sputorum aubsp. sputorum RM3237]ASM38774.1 putative membrane protein [Campylobacter sputorum bv. paraureolyticus LMG 11764]KAB0582849.1 peptidase M50 [Campylobacter sputorum subsp. sputorum]MDY6120574.1 peptidase M50 [Campylobacter sputorum]QEL05599.1 putative membrane protein [Campylobacter sputorum subsp. sputorum]